MPMLRKYPSASQAEIDELKKLVKKVDHIERQEANLAQSALPAPNLPPHVAEVNQARANLLPSATIFKEIGIVEPTRTGLAIDNPVQLLLLLRPELDLYPWQFEELMRPAGYLTTGQYKSADKTPITDVLPYKSVISAANGSGKDMILIAAFAVWFALKGVRNRVIITSSSFEQTKFQTEIHIRDLVNRANKRLGSLFRYTQFHYVCPELGSEIKLFATDEAKRAEGYHPYGDGQMAIITNEAKSINEEIFDALSRCTGYSHWLEISSPGPKSGHMYRMAGQAVHYPRPAVLGQFYFRRITAYDCPHLSKSHIDAMIADKGINNPLVRSSIFAEFSDFDEPVVVTESAYDKCYLNPPKHTGTDIGIGLDLAGGGDEDACFVRQGNKVIYKFFFRQSDTELAALLIDKQLLSWKSTPYSFRADNGGLGQAIIDKLVAMGWHIRRTNNQSPAFNKREFLNLGAEMYFYVKRLIERVDIILPDVEKLKTQLTSRRFDGFESTQGKYKLESKKEALSAGRPSPDRADAFVLCFASYRPSRVVGQDSNQPPARKTVTMAELLRLSARGQLRQVPPPTNSGVLTYQTGKI